MKTDEELKEANRKNEKMLEDNNLLRQQMLDKAAEDQANISLIKKQYEDAMERMEVEKKQREDMEQKKTSRTHGYTEREIC